INKVQGQGAEDPPLVGEYFSSDMIICVIDDPKLDEIIDAIASVACTGTKGDGKVFVTPIDDAFDICTKKRGTTSI
ncbi:MAG: P-II family nitrogen regulator, partial [Candidatus Nitrosopelagicus sp.]|nr:P-II family nitrogen regulator [Candidatus Nitrosopelagicus sp.]